MAGNNEAPPWLRPTPIFVIWANADDKNKPQSSASDPAPKTSPTTTSSTTRGSEMTSPNGPSPSHTAPSSVATDDNEQYANWRPQQMTSQRVHSPPLSPLDLAMYPGAPVLADPVAARRAVAGLKPLRILSSRRPGGTASAGPSRRPSVDNMNATSTFSGFIGLFSAARRASAAIVTGPSAVSPRLSQPSPAPVSHIPIPVSPLPPPRTPPLVPTPSLSPEQMVPELKAHLEALAAQTKSGPASSSSPRPIPTAQPALEGEEEDIVLEIKDLDAGKIITLKSRDVVASSDVVNPPHSTALATTTKEPYFRAKTATSQPNEAPTSPPSL